ncbi:MAG TPA: hypothetical protein VGB14_06790 [Acidimicrobiales bacterium]
MPVADPTPAVADPPRPADLPPWLATATGRLFGALSGARRARVFHPRGLTLHGTARLTGEVGRLLAPEATGPVPVVVRLSRGLGLRHPLPDFNGVAVKVPEAHGPGRDQDLLLVSSLRAPVGRHLLVPAPAFSSTGSSTILPYRTPHGLVLFRAGPVDPGTLADVPAGLPVTIELFAAPLLGRWERIAELVLDHHVADDEAADRELAFDPWHTGEDLVPAGLLNRLRLPAYAASRAARPGPAGP